jgi:hypothetical protein
MSGFAEFWEGEANDHQKRIFSTRTQSHRNLIVERQTGTTMGMTADAMDMAVDTGIAQVFVAPTVQQALLHKHCAAHLADKDGFIDFRKLMTDFRFTSPSTLLKAARGVSVFDLYVTDWIYMRDEEVELLRTFVRRQSPNRNTWVSSLPDLPKYKVLMGATQL